jgi:hypothetical protein
MPANKDLKRLVRTRMQKTGESYTTARAQLLAKKAPRVPAANLAELAGVSEDAVKKATGHVWKHWVGVLDRAGAAKWTHRDIARWLRDDHEVDGWWSQAVTVGYERIRGLRAKGQRRGGGWDVNKSKTIGVSVAKLYAAFATKRARDRWLGEVGLEVRKATRGKVMRMRWEDGTPLEAYFDSKGSAKSVVTIQHRSLASQAAADQMRAFWGGRLGALATLLAPSR